MRSLNDLVLLGVLHRSGKPMHVYAIRSVVERHHIHMWARISRTGLYGRIKILEENGWLTSQKERDGLMPERTIYDLTDAGREHLAELVAEAIRVGGFYNADMNAALAFADALSREEILDCLRDRLSRARHGRQALEKELQQQDEEFSFELFTDQLAAIIDSQVARTDTLIAKIEAQPTWGRESKATVALG
jgi:DNA-binding PadR family transcriptional regulator